MKAVVGWRHEAFLWYYDLYEASYSGVFIISLYVAFEYVFGGCGLCVKGRDCFPSLFLHQKKRRSFGFWWLHDEGLMG